MPLLASIKECDAFLAANQMAHLTTDRATLMGPAPNNGSSVQQQTVQAVAAPASAPQFQSSLFGAQPQPQFSLLQPQQQPQQSLQ